MNYTVEPGLYALGTPDEKSDVLVTGNYKLSFDHLRRELPQRSFWILALDTRGINVWCAAGKGTFGTDELVKHFDSSGIGSLVNHRRLILPQLSAPGVSAHQVKKRTGFNVVYGPIRAADLPVFLDNGLKATADMRRKSFPIEERAVLIPVELVGALKPALIAMAAMMLLGGLGGPAPFWSNVFSYGLFAALCLLIGILCGAVLTPLLLPWLPGRAFALKGFFMGLASALVLLLLRPSLTASWTGRLELFGLSLMILATAAFLAMNFTGASTYTSLSGVKKEMRWAVPMQIAGAALGLALWLTSRWMA
jgi:acetyl-CoA decarbonylase/synthase complex subunit gamma